MITKYVVKNAAGQFYAGLNFVNKTCDALQLATIEEAQSRVRLRSDWSVEEIQVDAPTRYLFEKIIPLALLLVLVLFTPMAQAQDFTQSQHINGVSGQHLTAADVRNKGYQDLIVGICIYLNNGDGTFTPGNCLVGGTQTAVGDFDGDGKQDFAITFGSQTIIYFGDGNGGLTGVNQSLDSLPVAAPGVYSGPVTANFRGGLSIAFATGNCSNGTIPDDAPLITPFQAYVEVWTFTGPNAGTKTTGMLPDCTAAIVGAVKTAGDDLIVLKGVTGTFFFGNGVQTTTAGTNAATFDSTLLTYDSLGTLDVYQSPWNLVASYSLPICCGQTTPILTGATFSNNQVGVVAAVSSSSQTPLLLQYGPDFSNLFQSGNAGVTHQPTAIVAGNFRPTGTPAQDIAVIDSTGLTVFVQGTFSGTFSVPSVVFTAQAIGTSAFRTIQFKNTGTASLSPLAISITGSADYTESNDCPANLLSGNSCDITIQFLPGTVETSSSATLSMTSKLINQSISVTGTEVLFGKPQPDQGSLAFGNQLIGTTSAAQVIHVFNAGNEAFTATLSGAPHYPSSNTCTNVQPNTSCQVLVQFAASLLAGQDNEVLTLTFDTAPQIQVPLTGFGATAPSIQTQPANQTVTLGQPVTFSVVNQGTAPISYQWKNQNGNITGATSISYSFTPAVADSGSVYSVTISSPFGTITSSTATLTVLTVPVITTSPQPIAVTLGQTATFSVVAAGSTPLHYAWTKAGVSVGTDSSTYVSAPTTAADNAVNVSIKVSNATASTATASAILSINFPVVLTGQPQALTVLVPAGGTALANFSVVATGTSDSFQWKRNNQNVGTNSSTYSFQAGIGNNGDAIFCVVSNAFGPPVPSNIVTLTVNSAPIVSQLSSTTTVAVGGSAVLNAAAIGTAPITWAWMKNGSAVASATSSTLSTSVLQASDDHDIFVATATNAFGSASTTFTVNVILPPVIGTQPVSQNVWANSAVTFSVVATANDSAALTYQWQRNGSNVGTNSSSYTTPTLTFGDNGEVFTVTISDIAGSTTSVPATLSINAAPSIVSTNPATTTIVVAQNSTSTITITATGSAPLTYQWWTSAASPVPGATNPTFTIPTATFGATQYFCIIKNGFSPNATSPIFTVSVIQGLQINTQPTSQTVRVGALATFQVGATSGLGAVTYKWLHNNVQIPGATSSTLTYQTTTADLAANAGVSTIQAVATSGGIDAPSAAVNLTVNNLPFTLAFQPQTQTVTAGVTASYTVSVNGITDMMSVVLSCQDSIPGSTCTVNQPGSTGQALILVTTTKAAGLPPWFIFVIPSLVLLAFWARPRFHRRLKFALLSASLLIFGGCAGGGNAPTKPPVIPLPTSHSYTFTVTGTIPAPSSQTFTATATLVIQ